MTLKMKLLEELKQIDGVEDRFCLMLGDIELIYRGKSFAHFHNDNELDIRLTEIANILNLVRRAVSVL